MFFTLLTRAFRSRKLQRMSLPLICLIIAGLAVMAHASPDPLAPLKTDTPRDTMRTFVEAMNDYKTGLIVNKNNLKERISDAVRCLNLEDVPLMTREQIGREAAVFLKEVIDRIIVIDYEKIPDDTGDKDNPLKRWRLKDTEIVISVVETGARAGEYLFSPDTVNRASDFYEKVKHLPYLPGSRQGAGYRAPWMQRHLPAWTKDRFLGLAYWQWLGLFVAILFGLVVRTLARFLVRLGKRVASKTPTKWDEYLVEKISAPIGFLAMSGFWFFSLYLLQFKGVFLKVLSITVQVLLFSAITWIAYRLAGVLSAFFKERAERTEDKLDDQLTRLLTRTLEIFVLVLGVLLAAQNLGIDVFSLLTGLGIGGLAVALAAQDSLANFFGSVMIMLDRPFKIGHWIKTDGAEGIVEDIGFRSTKIRSFADSIISVPNSVIAKSDVENFGMRNYRRVYTTLQITMDTPAEKIEAFLEGIKNIIKANPHTWKGGYYVSFVGFGPQSFDIMVYCYLDVPDWSEEILQKQNLFLEFVRLADAMGVRFAFPTQTIHVETLPDREPVAQGPSLNKDSLADMARRFGVDGPDARPEGSGIFVPAHREKS